MREAIVMAAGEGRRLRPVTESLAKPVLPIDGRPVLASLLRDVAAAGTELVTVVVGHRGEQIERLVGDGRAFGVEVRYVRQPEPLGSADAVLRALRAGARPPVLVVAADTLFSPGDVARFAGVFGRSGAAGAIAARRRPPPSPPHRWAMRIVAGRVEKVLDRDPANPLAGAPLWAADTGVTRFLDPLPGAEPYELSSAFQLAIDDGEVVAGVEIGQTRDLTHPLDLVMENFPYIRGVV